MVVVLPVVCSTLLLTAVLA